MDILNKDEYGGLICSHIKKCFPTIVNYSSNELVDIISNILIGTKEYRYGPLPSPEHQVVIRDIIKTSIKDNSPIPVLVPWGSIKANFSPALDMAEVQSILRLSQVFESIQKYYSPSLDIRLRLEDTSGISLFQLEKDKGLITENSNIYVDNMVKLIQILDANITPVKESDMPLAYKFEYRVKEYSPVIEEYLTKTDGLLDSSLELSPYKNLLTYIGFRGIILKAQREYYYESYKKLYPDWGKETLIKRLSLYLAGSLSRFQLGMTGKLDEDDKSIQFAFVPPVPGIPEGYNYSYVYNRTLPLSESRTHICPWRAKGYLKIDGNQIQTKITSFNNKEIIDTLIPSQTTLTNGANKIQIRTDYFINS